jgi:hypothetical protein
MNRTGERLRRLYADPNDVMHGFLRTLGGTITTIDAPGAGTAAYQGTNAGGINPPGGTEN